MAKIITSFIIIIILINICHISYAKYVYEYTITAAQLTIDRTPLE